MSFCHGEKIPIFPIMALRESNLSRVSLHDLSDRIRRARRMNVAALTSIQVLERIRILMDGYATQLMPVQLNGVFRARINPAGLEFGNTRELWYPPARSIVRRGRFNEVGQQVFYASNNAQGAIFEVQAPLGSTVTVLCCSTREDFVELRCAHIGLKRSVSPVAMHASHGSPLKNGRLQQALDSAGLSKKWQRIDEFLADMATGRWPESEQQDQYKITNAIASVLMGAPDACGLNYPSVATTLNSINLCLPPSVADEIFVPLEAWTLRTEERVDRLSGLDHTGPFFRTEFLRRSREIDSDGTIHWTDVEPGYPVEHLLKAPLSAPAPTGPLNHHPSSTPR